MRRHAKRSEEGWRANALELCLGANDVDLLDRILCVVPELRIVTFLAQQARKRDLKYPISTVAELAGYLGRDCFELAGYRIDRKAVIDAMPGEWFPIAHEGEFLSAIHLALHRCRREAVEQRLRQMLVAARRTSIKRPRKKG